MKHSRTRLRRIAAPLLAVMVLALAGCGGQRKPNIVLITLDTLRADRLAAYGGDPEWTPNLNRLAAQGTVFTKARTAIGTTFPSHATMMTGLYPHIHGVRSNRYALADAWPTVAEILGEHGYQTAAFVSFRQMIVRGRLGQGFQTRSDTKGPGHDQGLFRDGADTVRMTVDWLRQAAHDDRPKFLWMHLFDVHGPYRVNEWSRERLGDYDGMLKNGASMELLRTGSKIEDSPDDLAAMRTLYNGEAHKADHHVGQLLDALRDTGELDNTVLIIVADHGQGIGEHGHFGHGPILWEGVLRVPMIILDMRHPRHHEVDTLVGLVDLAPTMLDFAGVKTQARMQGRSDRRAVDGKSLKPATYYSEVELKHDPGPWYDPNLIAIYDNGFKYVTRPGVQELYDLDSDPEAEHPLDPGSRPAMADYFDGLAQDYLAQETATRQAELSQEDMETLRSLGYIQ